MGLHCRTSTRPGSFAHEWTNAGALNPSEFLHFTLTPGLVPIQYGSLDVTVFETAGVPGTETFELHASLDGFNTSDITLATQDFARNGVMNAFTGVDISALGTQAGEVQFRMYFYNATGSPFFSGLITNNMVLHSVPEPSSALLVGCGLGGVVLVRRRWPGRAQSGPPAAVRR